MIQARSGQKNNVPPDGLTLRATTTRKETMTMTLTQPSCTLIYRLMH